MLETEYLKGESYFRFFKEISSIPRGSGNTEQIQKYLINFAERKNLNYACDEIGNIVIYKDKSADSKSNAPVILQGHMDMVVVKTKDSDTNPEVDGVTLSVDGDWIKAKGTSLGADDGIAVSYMLSILDNDKLSHPPIEALFTVDEETGMLGAKDLDMSLLRGKRLINMDSEEDGIVYVSCAGGIDVKAAAESEMEHVKGDIISFTVSGLTGGHSGMEIDKGRANAAIITAKIINDIIDADFKPHIISIHSGEQDNAIATDGNTSLIIPESIKDSLGGVDSLKEKLLSIADKYILQYEETDPNMQISFNYGGVHVKRAYTVQATARFIHCICELPNGVISISEQLENLPETSLNLGIMRVNETSASASYLVRSNSDEKKKNLVADMKKIAKKHHLKTYLYNDYQAWEYREESEIRDVIVDSYEEITGTKPLVKSIHAGLECGILTAKRHSLDCVSIGPEILDVHTYNEKMSILSAKKNYKVITKALEKLAEKE